MRILLRLQAISSVTGRAPPSFGLLETCSPGRNFVSVVLSRTRTSPSMTATREPSSSAFTRNPVPTTDTVMSFVCTYKWPVGCFAASTMMLPVSKRILTPSPRVPARARTASASRHAIRLPGQAARRPHHSYAGSR